jgi:cytochrome c
VALVGPPLTNVFGRRAGAVEGFAYSEGLARAGADGLIWTLEPLDAYLENPRTIVSKPHMDFPGLPDPQDRADLLAYLRTQSVSPQDIPEAEPTALPHGWDIPETLLTLEGDAEYGAYLSSECVTCHRADGSYDGIPSITQWDPRDFSAALHAYKRKLRPHPVMQMIAGRLSDEEIAALAAYFAGLDG